MQRFFPGLLALVLLAGCGTSPVNTESTRNTVLQYLGGQVGTAGPFSRGGKKELDVLSAADRQKVSDLIDRGAVIFLVYGGQQGASKGASRIVVVQGEKIVGDFFAQPDQPAAVAQ